MSKPENKLPLSRINGQEARLNSIGIDRHPDEDYTRMCLRFVRKCWDLDAYYATAREAWANAETRVPFTDVDSIPVGAPVFSRKVGSDDPYWHVFIAGGWYRDGKRRVRVFRSTDIKAPGEVDNCRIQAFTERWGHEILGWTKDLNGVRLDFSD